MTARVATGFVAAAGMSLLIVACGGSPIAPPPPPPPPQPPANNPPVIESVTIQGTRANEPSNFADASEIVEITARVRDDETATDQLQYVWSAAEGTFAGTGPRVTWQSPTTVAAPATVAIRLEVVERYGSANQFEHRVSRSESVNVHDSVREVSDLARQFLLDFSDTNIKDASYIMRNFADPAKCPQPNEVNDEREQVTDHFTNFRMIDFRIGPATVTMNFKGVCPISLKHGDACAVVPAYWHSFNRLTNKQEEVDGRDILAAIYSPSDSRWWLCASTYDGRSLSSAVRSFYIR
jgi:hypothetical protein